MMMFWCLTLLRFVSHHEAAVFDFTRAPPLSSCCLFIQPGRVSLRKPADSGVFVFVSRLQAETLTMTGSEYFCPFPSVSPLVFFVHHKLNKGDYEGRERKGKRGGGRKV